jgi:hypothetical protein
MKNMWANKICNLKILRFALSPFSELESKFWQELAWPELPIGDDVFREVKKIK